MTSKASEPAKPAVRAGMPQNDMAHAMRRAAFAVSRAGGPDVVGELVRDLAAILQADVAFAAVFSNDERTHVRTLGAQLDGRTLRNFEYPLAGSPCAEVVGREFRFVPRGVAARFKDDTIFAAKRMDCYAAYPLTDSAGEPLGLLAAMNRKPIEDAELAESMLKIFAVRIAAEIERGRAEEGLRSAALTVSNARGEGVFPELVRYLATILKMEIAFIALTKSDDPCRLEMLALYMDGEIRENFDYDVRGTPCESVIGQEYRAYPSGLNRLFPDDQDYAAIRAESYAGFPLRDSRGTPLGLIAVVSRKPMSRAERVESLLQIFAVRASAEIERSRAEQALRESEASYRAIFEAAEDAILIHDWDTGAILDVNPKAGETFGYSCEEMRGISVGQISSDVPPFTLADAARWFGKAKSHGPVQFEWHRRNKDGSLHWDEVRLKSTVIGGHRRILAFSREITERKLAEEALRTSEEQYRAIFNGSADALILWDSRLKRVDVNPAYERIYGWSRDEVIGRGFEGRTLPPDYAEPRLDMVRRALAGEMCHASLESIRKNGERIQTDIHMIPIQHRGEPHALAIARDITESRNAQERLRASEEQYRAIFNASVDGLLLKNAEHRIVDVNDAYLSMHGYRREELIGKRLAQFIPAELQARYETLLPGILKGEPYHLEARTYRRDGSLLDAEIHGVPMQYLGQPHALVIVRDITQRRLAEEALRASEEQYRAIFNASADALMLWNSRLQRVDVNPAHEKIFGFAREEVVGRGFEGLSYPEDFVRPRIEMVRRALAGEACRAELEALRKDGQRIITELRTIPFLHRGEPHVLQIARDITERKRAEEERAKLESQLRQAQKMEAIGHLTGGIAHDFNNILTSVMGYIALGAERAHEQGDAKLEGYFGQIDRAAQRARDLIQQMLTFSRGQRGQRSAISLARLVSESLGLLRSSLPATIDLEDRLDADAPPAMIDPVQIEQVFLNLCINARDAIGGAGRIRAEVRAVDRAGAVCGSCKGTFAGRYVELSVCDSGPGIRQEVLDRMFEPFFSTKDVGHGSGMGLAMVHGIVHEHGGHILVETSRGQGATFRILLPVVSEPAAQPGVDPPGAATQSRRPQLHGRVLVVDDEQMVAEFMGELLSGWALEATVMRDPIEAESWLSRDPSRVDVVITDQTMPKMTGLELARRLRSLRPDLPVILYTGYTEKITQAVLDSAGVGALLQKPIQPAALFELLGHNLQQG